MTVKYKDLSGQTFASWLVLGPGARRQSDGQMYWNCRCKCGTEKEVSGGTLKRGTSQQCQNCKHLADRRGECTRGHNKNLWGVDKHNGCRACIKEDSLLRNYGITLPDFIALYEAQDGKCACCGKDLGPIFPGSPGWDEGCRIEVDHEHGCKGPVRNSVRGLLCGGRYAGCNRKLGRIDKIDWLTCALQYITAPPARALFEPITVKPKIKHAEQRAALAAERAAYWDIHKQPASQ